MDTNYEEAGDGTPFIIASRDRLSAAIEALIAHGVQAHMSTSEASKALAKRKRFEQRNGIHGGLGG